MSNMECAYYEEIPSSTTVKQNNIILFWRQLFISSAIWTFYFIYGIYLGAPTVFIPQLRREANSTEAVSDETAASISAVYGFAGIPWIFIAGFLSFRYGKKIPLFVLSVLILTGAIVFYCSTNMTHIFISQTLLSSVGSSQVVMYMTVISEYTAPEFRGLFMTIKSASCFWGLWVSNAIGAFFHWKNIGIFGLICSIYPVLIIPFWPESPYWLASRGKFDECAASHRWLKGTGEGAEKELKRLLSTSSKSELLDKDLLTKIKTKEIYKPFLVGILLFTQVYACGKLACSVYSIDLIKRVTKSESTAIIGMLILDGFSVLSTYIGCLLSKKYNRKTLLLLFASLSCVALLSMSVYLFLIQKGLFIENSYVSIALLSVYSCMCCLGPMILCTSIVGELLPLKCRILFICIISVIERLEFSVVLKVLPNAMKTFGLAILFFVFGIVSLFLNVLVYLYLPETNDKTLQEIGDSMKSGERRLLEGSRELSILVANNKSRLNVNIIGKK